MNSVIVDKEIFLSFLSNCAVKSFDCPIKVDCSKTSFRPKVLRIDRAINKILAKFPEMTEKATKFLVYTSEFDFKNLNKSAYFLSIAKLKEESVSLTRFSAKFALYD